MNKIKISPSILSADFAHLGEEVKKLCESGADYIHLDVMDGHFVPNITIGPDIIKAIKKFSTVPLDVHLMINKLEHFLETFIKYGADIITFHIEATSSPTDLIKHIKKISKNVKVGIALSPSTEVSAIEHLISQIDLVLVMTVNPGFSNQTFLLPQLQKIVQISEIKKRLNSNIEISVDGGINPDTAKMCINAGANTLVSGSYLFSLNNRDYVEAINKLRNINLSG